MKTAWLAACAAAVLLAAPPALCEPSAAAVSADGPRDLTKAPRMGPWGFDMSGADRATPAGKSFFQFANGGAIAKMPIPSDRTNYGAFNALDDLSRDRMRAVIDKAVANPSPTGNEAKVAALYRSFMDEKRVNALGARPLASDLARVRAARTHDDIARLMGVTSKSFGQSTFTIQLYDDAKDPLKYTVYLGQGGITLPDRDYYLEPGFAKERKAYESYIARQLSLAGWPEPAANAQAI